MQHQELGNPLVTMRGASQRVSKLQKGRVSVLKTVLGFCIRFLWDFLSCEIILAITYLCLSRFRNRAKCWHYSTNFFLNFILEGTEKW